MELNRVSAPNEGATGVDLTNDASVNGAAAEGRAAITMVRTHDAKVWRGRDLGGKARLRIVSPPGKAFPQPIKGGWLGRVRHMLQVRSEHAQDQSTKRLAALTPDQSPALQGGPRWLRGIGAIRGQLQGLIARLKERAVIQTTRQASAVAGAAAVSSSVVATITAAAHATVNANPDSAALAQVTVAVQQRFAAQAGNKEAFTDLLKQAFGDKFDAGKAETIRQQALAGDFSWAPKVQVVDSPALADLSGTQAAGSAQGAYVKDSDTIYISRELLHSDPAQAQRLLMEEMGHGIDARINTSDAVGDEGEIFAKLMHGDAISSQEMATLKADNDSGVISINGRNVTVEYGWFKKAFKAITGGIKKIVSAVVDGAVNLAKAAINVAVGLVTLDFNRVQRGFQQGFSAVTTTFKEVTDAVKDTAKELHKIAKEQFKKLMQSKVFAAVLMICRFIPIPIVQLVVRVIDLVRAAYMVYQGIKNKSIGAVLGGIASLAGGASNLAGSLGASASTVAAIKDVATAASQVSMAYNAIANKDIGAAMGLLGGAVGGPSSSSTMNTLVTVGGYAQQAMNIRQAVRSGDALGALGGTLGLAGTAVGGDSPMSQDLVNVKEVVTGLQAVREINRGNLDAAQSLASGMNSAQQASRQADAILVQQRADVAAANNRSLLNAADKDLRALPAEQEGAPTATNDSEADPAATAADEQRNGSDVDSDNMAARNGGVGPVSTQTLFTVSKGQTLEGIARAQYGENWRAGLAQIALDNGLKLNQWGSPILGVGKTLVLNDLSGKTEQELANLSRTGGRIVSNNDKGLAAKADLEERARQAAAQKAQEATAMAVRVAENYDTPSTSQNSSSGDAGMVGGLGTGLMLGARQPGTSLLFSNPKTAEFFFETLPNKASANPANPADIRRYYQWSDKLLNLDPDLARDLTVRRDTYLKPVEAIPGKFAVEPGADLGTYEAHARAAGAERNAVMENTRSELTDKGRAFSSSMKPEGKTYEQTLKEAFKSLSIDPSIATEAQLKAANELVIEKAGKSNPSVSELAMRAGDLQRAQKVVTVANGVGKAAVVVGVAVDAYSLGTEINRSIETNSVDPALRESTRIAGGWTGAWGGAKAGAAGLGAVCAIGGSVVPVLGTATGGAVCAVIGGVGGGIGGYWAGSNAATKVYDAGKSVVNPEPRKP